MEIKGIDVSVHNGNIDWEKVKADGVEFAIIRCGYGMKSPKQKDGQFERNYAECKKHGIPVGVYHYSYAHSEAEALAEADFVLELIKDKQFEYPVVFDLEDKSQMNLGKEQLTKIAEAFCGKIEAAGYYVSLYCNADWYRNRLDRVRLAKYDLWLAEWRSAKSFECGIWQYISKGKVNGISGDVDMNIAYKNYPQIIKSAGLNGFAGKYSVTARIANLSKSQADKIVEICQKQGMLTVVSEED